MQYPNCFSARERLLQSTCCAWVVQRNDAWSLRSNDKTMSGDNKGLVRLGKWKQQRRAPLHAPLESSVPFCFHNPNPATDNTLSLN
jgi:hypothetical protein